MLGFVLGLGLEFVLQLEGINIKEDISFAKSDKQSIFAFTVLPQRPLAEQAYKS